MTVSLATMGHVCAPAGLLTESIRVIDVQVEVDVKTVETSVEIIT